MVMWAAAGGVGDAASPHPSASATSPCQPVVAREAVAGLDVGLTLAQAKACWPHAVESSTGDMAVPGEYLIPHGRGWIHAGWSIVARHSTGHGLGIVGALALPCGEQVNWTVQSWEQWLDNVTFTTGDVASECYDAWSTWQTPACSGFGRCLTPVFGVIGQRTATVNPWYNQTVDYLAMTEFFYCRHYISDLGSISAYCR
jgi:hypothetical protein